MVDKAEKRKENRKTIKTEAHVLGFYDIFIELYKCRSKLSLTVNNLLHRSYRFR